MIIVVVLMTAATVALAAFVLAPRLAEGRIVYDLVPDPPAAFGHRMSWLAVRTRDGAALAASLGLAATEPANWRTGLGVVYDHHLGETHIFVSPPVNGWTFVAGLALPAPVGRRFVDKGVPLLLALGQRFIEVQYFACHPAIDHFAWARVIDGKMLRAFAIGDDGVIWNKGRPTKEEKAMGLKLFEMRGMRGRKGDAGGEILLYPTDEHIMQLAAKWSIDPTRLGIAHAAPALGIVGIAPADWRAERIRKAA